MPFIFGMEQHPNFLEQVTISKDIPSVCASKLLSGEVDLGLVPVAIIPKLKEAHILSDYCIGANEKVKSVLLVSEVPLSEITSIILDYQSRTSVKLCELLAKNYWKIKVDYQAADEGYEEKITGTTAGVIIGDRTFHLNGRYSYQYDLAEQWHLWQKLPFVFAAWVSNKPLDSNFINDFNAVLKFGIDNIDAAVKYFNRKDIDQQKQLNYLKENISYHLDSKKLKALNRYLELLETN